jgi:uncharacterized protein (TIGR03437 family)
MYATGLGLSGGVLSGYPARAPVQLDPSNGVTTFTYLSSTNPGDTAVVHQTTEQFLVQPDWVGLAAGYVGLYQVNVTVPSMPGSPSCGSIPGGNVYARLPGGIYANTIAICVQL